MLNLNRRQSCIEAPAEQTPEMTLGSKEVLGYKDYQGTGFVIEGTANYIASGPEFDMMKEKFSFLTRVFEVTIVSAKQML